MYESRFQIEKKKVSLIDTGYTAHFFDLPQLQKKLVFIFCFYYI